MDERTKSRLITLLATVFFVICVALVVIGQKNIGVPGTLTMLAGLAGLVLLLFLYNKQFK